jgi:hypothetical protein
VVPKPDGDTLCHLEEAVEERMTMSFVILAEKVPLMTSFGLRLPIF